MARPKLRPAGEHVFQLRLPLPLWEALRKAAHASRRSANAEVLVILERALARPRRTGNAAGTAHLP